LHEIEKDRIHHQNHIMNEQLLTFYRENVQLRQSLCSEQLKTANALEVVRKDRAVQSKRKRDLESEEQKKASKVQTVEREDGCDVQDMLPYTPLSTEQTEEELIGVFANLFCLGDILKLVSHPHCRCLKKNLKFERLLGIAAPVRALEGLVGLVNIKKKAFDIIAHYALNRTPCPSDLMHMVIEGPPGVGKTEVGRLLGKVIMGLGVLTSDKFICARRSDLIGEFLGQTAPRTQAVIDSAMGGILFIDEAYSLGHPEKRDSFSKECIDTLNQNLTEKKGQFLCIIAGYEAELESCFFSVNKGLQRRFPVRMSITGYTPEELHEIFMLKVSQDAWIMETPEIVLKLFVEKHKYFHFYAGDTETLFYQAKFIAAGRLLRSSTQFVVQPTLTPGDVSEAYMQSMQKREKSDGPTLDMYA
jgi:hypothetical protein